MKVTVSASDGKEYELSLQRATSAGDLKAALHRAGASKPKYLRLIVGGRQLSDLQLIGELTDTTELLVYLVDRKPKFVDSSSPPDPPDAVIFHVVELNRRFKYSWDGGARLCEFGADFARVIRHHKEQLEYTFDGRRLSPLITLDRARLTGGQTISVRRV